MQIVHICCVCMYIYVYYKYKTDGMLFSPYLSVYIYPSWKWVHVIYTYTVYFHFYIRYFSHSISNKLKKEKFYLVISSSIFCSFQSHIYGFPLLFPLWPDLWNEQISYNLCWCWESSVSLERACVHAHGHMQNCDECFIFDGEKPVKISQCGSTTAMENQISINLIIKQMFLST